MRILRLVPDLPRYLRKSGSIDFIEVDRKTLMQAIANEPRPDATPAPELQGQPVTI